MWASQTLTKLNASKNSKKKGASVANLFCFLIIIMVFAWMYIYSSLVSSKSKVYDHNIADLNILYSLDAKDYHERVPGLLYDSKGNMIVRG